MPGSNDYYASRPRGIGPVLLRLLREFDDYHDVRFAASQRHRTEWTALLDSTLQRQLDAVAIFKGNCSLDFFLCSWLKNVTIMRYGTEVWLGLTKKYVLTEPEPLGSRPAFALADWHPHLNGHAQNQSTPHIMMGFAAFRLELDVKYKPCDYASSQPKPSVACEKQHVDDAPKPKLAAVQGKHWEPLDKFLDNAWHAQLHSSNFSGIHQAAERPWTIVLPKEFKKCHLGDEKSIELLINGVCLNRELGKSGEKLLRVMVPRSSYEPDHCKVAWTNGVLHSVWLRRLWRAYSLLSGWKLKMADAGKDIDLVEYLQSFAKADEDQETAAYLTKRLEPVERRLKAPGSAKQPPTKK